MKAGKQWRDVQGGGGTASRISFSYVVVMNRPTEEAGQESMRIMMFADDL